MNDTEALRYWKDLILPPIMLILILRDSEHRRPIINLGLFILFMTVAFPCTVVALFRPQRAVHRLLSGFSTVGTEESYDDEDEISGIGGGAINEKKRLYVPPTTEEDGSIPTTVFTEKAGFTPLKHQSHLYHALEGLDRYPNYLQRWNEDDIGKLEETLKQKLAIIRQQRMAIQEQQTGLSALMKNLMVDHPERERWNQLLTPCQQWKEVRDRILDPRAADAIFKSKQFSSQYSNSIPTVAEVREGRTKVQLDPERLQVWLDEELYDVYSFHLLSASFCKDVRDYIKALASLCESSNQPELHQFGKRPFNLDRVGLGWVNDILFHLVMKPIARELFLDSEKIGGDLDWRNGYIAGYSAQPGHGKPRERLVTHTDDSEVTMNVCLGDVFQGGLLEFRGLRSTPKEGNLEGSFQPQLGLALMHAGRHFHDVTQVVSGDRFAYIMWARSWNGIRSQQCACCWLNRREDKNDCICGARWN